MMGSGVFTGDPWLSCDIIVHGHHSSISLHPTEGEQSFPSPILPPLPSKKPVLMSLASRHIVDKALRDLDVPQLVHLAREPPFRPPRLLDLPVRRCEQSLLLRQGETGQRLHITPAELRAPNRECLVPLFLSPGKEQRLRGFGLDCQVLTLCQVWRGPCLTRVGGCRPGTTEIGFGRPR
jgi:hypothetical protein